MQGCLTLMLSYVIIKLIKTGERKMKYNHLLRNIRLAELSKQIDEKSLILLEDKGLSLNQKSKVVEFSLLQIPLLPFFSKEEKNGHVIMKEDNVLALVSFCNGDYSLNGLKHLKDFNDMKFNDLDPMMQCRIEDKVISFYSIYPDTTKEISFDILGY